MSSVPNAYLRLLSPQCHICFTSDWIHAISTNYLPQAVKSTVPNLLYPRLNLCHQYQFYLTNVIRLISMPSLPMLFYLKIIFMSVVSNMLFLRLFLTFSVPFCFTSAVSSEPILLLSALGQTLCRRVSHLMPNASSTTKIVSGAKLIKPQIKVLLTFHIWRGIGKKEEL